MFNVAFCDDSKLQREIFAGQLSIYKARRRAPISLTIYSEPQDLLLDSERIGFYDLYILDLVMPNIDGMKTAAQLRNKGYKGLIIFLSSSTDYLLESYDVKAFHYLTKPVDIDKMYKVLDDAINVLITENAVSVLAKTKDGERKIVLSSVYYIDKQNRALNFHITNKRVIECITLRTSFEEATQEMVDDKQFILCGTSLVLNLEMVVEVSSSTVLLKNGEQVFPPLSSIPYILKKFKEYWDI